MARIRRRLTPRVGRAALLPQAPDVSAHDGYTPPSGRSRRVSGGLWIRLTQRLQHVAFHGSNRYAVAVDDAVARHGSYALAGRDDPGEVQWIGRADRVEAVVAARAANLTQAFDGVRESILLPGDT